MILNSSRTTLAYAVSGCFNGDPPPGYGRKAVLERIRIKAGVTPRERTKGLLLIRKRYQTFKSAWPAFLQPV
jgi:hypothetical protein